MLEVEYDQTEAELVAFADDYCTTADRPKRSIRRVRAIAGGLFLLWGAIILWSGTRPILGTATLAFGSAYAFLYGPFYRWASRRSMLKNLRSGRNELQLGRMTLSLRDTEVRGKMEKGESTIHCSAIERLSESESHHFIYHSTNSAWAIPKAGIQSGDLNEFMEHLRERVESRSDV